MRSRDDAVAFLLTYLEDPQRMADGVTVDDMARELGVGPSATRRTIHDVRKFLGDTGDRNLVADPDPANLLSPHLYRLVGEAHVAAPWINDRIGDAHTRIDTIHAVVRSVSKKVDKRTANGRKALLIERSLGRLLEDLEDIEPLRNGSPRV